jgi:hypothetical protein
MLGSLFLIENSTDVHECIHMLVYPNCIHRHVHDLLCDLLLLLTHGDNSCLRLYTCQLPPCLDIPHPSCISD